MRKLYLLQLAMFLLMGVEAIQKGDEFFVDQCSTATPGNATLNCVLNRGLIANTATTVTVTNSSVIDAKAHITCNFEAADATAGVRYVTPSAGQYILAANVACGTVGGCPFTCYVHGGK